MTINIDENIKEWIEFDRFEWKVKKNTPKSIEIEVQKVLQWLKNIK